MTKQNKLIKLLILVAVVSVGLVAWQNYELRMAQKKAKLHITKAAYRVAYFLHTSRDSIVAINVANNWDDLKTRDSLRVWLSYSRESQINLFLTLDNFPSHVPIQDITNFNDISDWYSQWWGEAANILVKPGPLSNEDKAHITKLSNIVSKVDDFLNQNKYNNWDGIASSFAELHKEWKKEIEEKSFKN